MGLSGFFNVMRGDDHSLIAIFGDLHQMVPDALSEQRIHSNSGLIQNKQLWVMH